MSAVIEQQKPKLLAKLGGRFHIDPEKMLPTLKATAFKTAKNITNEQMIALLVVADQYELNPWTKEIYAFPDKFGGVVPVVGVDGWSRIINSHPEFDGMDFEFAPETVDNAEHKPCPEWVKCRIHRKDRGHPIEVTEYFDECYRSPMGNPPKPGPWQTHPKRFLRHKAMIQCSRLAMGFVGIFDQDEAERIVEAEVVSPQPKRSTSVVQAVIEEENIQVDESQAREYVEQIKNAVFDQDDAAIEQLIDEMDQNMRIVVERKLPSTDRTYIRNMGTQSESIAAEQ